MTATTCSPACVSWSVQMGALVRATHGAGQAWTRSPPLCSPGRPVRPLTSRLPSSLCPSACHTHTQKPSQTSGGQMAGFSWEKRGLSFQSQRGSSLLGRPPPPADTGNPTLPTSTVRASPLQLEISHPEAFTPQKSAQGRKSTSRAWASQDNLVPLGSWGQCWRRDGLLAISRSKSRTGGFHENATRKQACSPRKVNTSASVSKLVGSALSVAVFAA